MNVILIRILALVAVATLALAACDGASDRADEAAPSPEETEAVTEAPVETPEEEATPEVEEEAAEEQGGPPATRNCDPKDQGPASRPSRARVLKGEIRPLTRDYCSVLGTITVIRLPPEQGETVISVDGIRGLEDGTYEVVGHTGGCKVKGGPPYTSKGKKLGGKFKVQEGSAKEPEVRARGIAGKDLLSVVLYEKGRPLACADVKTEG